MVRTGIWCERVLGTEVLSIDRPALAKEDCVMELCGRALFYWIALRSDWIWASACGLDEAAERPSFCLTSATARRVGPTCAGLLRR